MGAKETIREKSALGLFAPLANKHTVPNNLVFEGSFRKKNWI